MTSPLRIFIVDDEAPARNRLREVLADCHAQLPLIVAGEAASGRDALAWLRQHETDVVLLDIHMPEMSGLELAQQIQKLSAPPAIVFTTAYDQHAIAAFEVSAADYLLKPVRAERLLASLHKARALVLGRRGLGLNAGQSGEAARQPRANLTISERGRVILVPVADIVYLRAEQKYITIRTLAHEYLSEESLTQLEQEFAQRFVRIHRSCLVARDWIAGFQRVAPGPATGEHEGGHGWVVLLKGVSEKLPVSRRQQHIVKEFRE
jgi:two-component system, LytTR family, response regulator AlgR